MKYFNNRDSKGRFTKVQGNTNTNVNTNTNTIKEESTMKANTNTTKKATTTAEYKVSTGKEMTSLEFSLVNLNNGVRIITPVVNDVKWSEFGMAYVTEEDKEAMIKFFNEVINATGGDRGKAMTYLMEFGQNATSKEFMEKYKKGEIQKEIDKKEGDNTLTQAVKDEDNTYEVNIGSQMTSVEFTVQALNDGVRVLLPVVNGEEWPELRMGYVNENDKKALIKCFNTALTATGGDKYRTMRYLYEFYRNATDSKFMKRYEDGEIQKEVNAEQNKEYFDIDDQEYFIDYEHKYLVDNSTGEIVADLDCYKGLLKEDLTREQIQTLLIREYYLNQNNN